MVMMVVMATMVVIWVLVVEKFGGSFWACQVYYSISELRTPRNSICSYSGVLVIHGRNTDWVRPVDLVLQLLQPGVARPKSEAACGRTALYSSTAFVTNPLRQGTSRPWASAARFPCLGPLYTKMASKNYRGLCSCGRL